MDFLIGYAIGGGNVGGLLLDLVIAAFAASLLAILWDITIGAAVDGFRRRAYLKGERARFLSEEHQLYLVKENEVRRQLGETP